MKKNIFKMLAMFLFLCTVAQNYGAAESSAEKRGQRLELLQKHAFDQNKLDLAEEINEFIATSKKEHLGNAFRLALLHEEFGIADKLIDEGADITILINCENSLNYVAQKAFSLAKDIENEINTKGQLSEAHMIKVQEMMNVIQHMNERGLKPRGRGAFEMQMQKLHEIMEKIGAAARSRTQQVPSEALSAAQRSYQKLLNTGLIKAYKAGDIAEATVQVKLGADGHALLEDRGRALYLVLADDVEQEIIEVLKKNVPGHNLTLESKIELMELIEAQRPLSDESLQAEKRVLALIEQYNKQLESSEDVPATQKTPQEQEALNSQFAQAILDGDEDAAKELIDAGVDLMVKVLGWPALVTLAHTASLTSERIEASTWLKNVKRKKKDEEELRILLELIRYMEKAGVKKMMTAEHYLIVQEKLKQISESPFPNIQQIFKTYLPSFGIEQSAESTPAQQPKASEITEYKGVKKGDDK